MHDDKDFEAYFQKRLEEHKELIADYFLPEKWKMVNGKLLLGDMKALMDVLRLITMNLGVRTALNVIPYEMIKQYVQEKEYSK